MNRSIDSPKWDSSLQLERMPPKLKKKVQFTVRGRCFLVTPQLVTNAMRTFNSTARLAGRDSGNRYAVFDKVGMPYPPKRILSICTGCRLDEFSAGARVNNVFRMLGFQVRKASDAIRLQERWPRTLPSIKILLKRLFSQKWSKFDQEFIFNFRCRFDARYPGVYMFAYPKERSSSVGKHVKEHHVYYVGSSPYAGLGARLTNSGMGRVVADATRERTDSFVKTARTRLTGDRYMLPGWRFRPTQTRRGVAFRISKGWVQ